MIPISYFSKIPFDQYLAARNMPFGAVPAVEEMFVAKEYERLKIPERATTGSAGYDFYMPYNLNVRAGVPVTVSTGINWISMEHDNVLLILPRSSLGFRYGMRMANTCCVIDSDFWLGETRGNILIRFVTDTDVCFNEGDRFAQGIILPYQLAQGDDVRKERTGGIGSTGN